MKKYHMKLSDILLILSLLFIVIGIIGYCYQKGYFDEAIHRYLPQAERLIDQYFSDKSDKTEQEESEETQDRKAFLPEKKTEESKPHETFSAERKPEESGTHETLQPTEEPDMPEPRLSDKEEQSVEEAVPDQAKGTFREKTPQNDVRPKPPDAKKEMQPFRYKTPLRSDPNVIYSWRDPDGIRHFTNTPPPEDATDVRKVVDRR